MAQLMLFGEIGRILSSSLEKYTFYKFYNSDLIPQTQTNKMKRNKQSRPTYYQQK